MGTAQPMPWPPLDKREPLEFPVTLDIPEGCGEFIAGRISSTPGRVRPDKAMADSLKERLLADPLSLVILSDEELDLLRRTTEWLGSRAMFNGAKRESILTVSRKIRAMLYPPSTTSRAQFKAHQRYMYGWNSMVSVYGTDAMKKYVTLQNIPKGLSGKSADYMIIDEYSNFESEDLK